MEKRLDVLGTCLDALSQEGELDGYVYKDRKVPNATRRLVIDDLPTVLVLHLKRSWSEDDLSGFSGTSKYARQPCLEWYMMLPTIDSCV